MRNSWPTDMWIGEDYHAEYKHKAIVRINSRLVLFTSRYFIIFSDLSPEIRMLRKAFYANLYLDKQLDALYIRP